MYQFRDGFSHGRWLEDGEKVSEKYARSLPTMLLA